MNTAVTYSEWNQATLTGLTSSPGQYMTLVCSVTVNVRLADDDVFIRSGVNQTKMPRTDVKDYWLSPSVDAFQGRPKIQHVHLISGGNKERSVEPGDFKRQPLPNETR